MQHHILIVDDEDEIRDLLGEFLAGQGYRVTGVATALEALRIAPAGSARPC
jgi:CheY-like chemotaxis protein